MRSLSGPAVTALAGRALPIALLVEMDLTTPLNLCSGSIDLTISGTTYYGTRGLGSIDAVQDTPAEIVAALPKSQSRTSSSSRSSSSMYLLCGPVLTRRLAHSRAQPSPRLPSAQHTRGSTRRPTGA